MKVCDGIYAYIWRGVFENNCNTFYFGEPLNMLFDPGLRHHIDLRFMDMKKDGLNPDDIKYVVNTHCHPDHVEGSEYFVGTDVKIAMHEDEISFMNQEGPQFFALFGMKYVPYAFDPVLREGSWEVAGVKLEVFQTPGHSPGSVCVYWPEKKALICGDLIFKESMGRVDFPGGSPEKLKESITRMSKIDVEILLPGHMDLLRGSADIKRNFALIERYVMTMM